MRRWLCLIAAMLCVLSATGCSRPAGESAPVSEGEVPVQEQESPATFAVAYSKDDTLNPYAAATEANLNLAGLLYDSLTVIDGAFMPRLSLAGTVESTDATHLEATLRPGAVFSDGTPVQVSDVLASFHAAKASQHYKALLSNVTAAKADTRTGVITFTLVAADPQAAACLSFPIYMARSATTAKGEAPTGSGPYVLMREEGTVYLARNKRWQGAGLYDRVELRHLPNSESMYYGLASQDITYYYNDLNTGDIPRVTASSAAVDMNALVFLGVNGGREPLKIPAVRQALSLLVDRSTLASATYSGWAKAATLPFHPAWEPVTAITGVSATRDLAAALERLASAGYGTGAGQKKLSLELICSADGNYRTATAQLIRSELESAGIKLVVTPLPYADYKKRLASGNYDLYLGEVRLSANMDLSPLLPGGNAGYGVPGDSPTVTAWRGYREGTVTVEAFTEAFLKDMPYIPLCWRCGFAAYDRRLSVVTPHGYAPYYDFVSWK